MSNPRRFGEIVLLRVTEKLTLAKAKREAKRIRESGVQARVDTFEGAHAVWSTKKRKTSEVKRKSRPARKMITIYHGTTSSKLSSIKKSTSIKGYWTEHLGHAFSYAMQLHDLGFMETKIKGYPIILEAKVPKDWLVIYQHERHSIEGFTLGRGSQSKQLPAKHLKAIWHFRENYLAIHFSDNTEIHPDSKHFERRAGKSMFVMTKKSTKQERMITLYHGTLSSTLPRIIRSKKVIGQWTNDPRLASQYAVMEYSESPTTEKGRPIIIVAKVPESIISDYEDNYGIVMGFNLKGGQVKVDKTLSYIGDLKTSETTAQLPIRFILHILHIKRIDATVYMDEFNRKNWVKGKL